MELRFTDKSSLTLSNNFYPLEHCQLGSTVCGLREATLTEIEVAQKFFFLLLNVKPSGVIVYDSFTKLLKNIKNYRLLLKMKRKKNVWSKWQLSDTDNWKHNLRSFFLLTLKQFKLKDSIYSNHEMCCTNDTQRWPHHPRNDHKESTTTET